MNTNKETTAEAIVRVHEDNKDTLWKFIKFVIWGIIIWFVVLPFFGYITLWLFMAGR